MAAACQYIGESHMMILGCPEDLWSLGDQIDHLLLSALYFHLFHSILDFLLYLEVQ